MQPIIPYMKNAIQTYIHKVASLDHKIFDNTMKRTAFITNRDTIFPIFACTKLPEANKLYGLIHFSILQKLKPIQLYIT